MLDNTNAVIDKTIPLLGGTSVNQRGATTTFHYVNIHGDVTATADNSGTKQGSTFTYDPYGQPLTATPDNETGNFDYGWLGQHQRQTEHEGTIDTIEMGARQYVPGLGRFIEMDPIEGGSANDYDYAFGDPVNIFDLDGRCPPCAAAAAMAAARAGVAAYGAYRIYQATQAALRLHKVYGALGRGSTGRVVARNLKEQLAMEQVLSRSWDGTKLTNITMKDPRWLAKDGWVKMQKIVNGVKIHWVRNTRTGQVDDFKFS